jgi:hypothetical protein
VACDFSVGSAAYTLVTKVHFSSGAALSESDTFFDSDSDLGGMALTSLATDRSPSAHAISVFTPLLDANSSVLRMQIISVLMPSVTQTLFWRPPSPVTALHAWFVQLLSTSPPLTLVCDDLPMTVRCANATIGEIDIAGDRFTTFADAKINVAGFQPLAMRLNGDVANSPSGVWVGGSNAQWSTWSNAMRIWFWEAPQVPLSCLDALVRFGKTTSGAYQIDPSGTGRGSLTTWCDQTSNGGGWTLVTKVHVHPTFASRVSEPDDFFDRDLLTGNLTTATLHAHANLSSWALTRFRPLMRPTTSLFRFTLVSVKNPAVSRTVFKRPPASAAQLPQWGTSDTAGATTLCETVTMDSNCKNDADVYATTGPDRIVFIKFGTGGGTWTMYLDGDAADVTGVVGDDVDANWQASGNGLLVYFREN